MVDEFLGAQRAIRNYQATGELGPLGNAVAGSVPGSGLGMSIARTIVANHGGDISVRSAEGEGTTVTVRIALAAPDVPPARMDRTGGTPPAMRPEPPSRSRPARRHRDGSQAAL